MTCQFPATIPYFSPKIRNSGTLCHNIIRLWWKIYQVESVGREKMFRLRISKQTRKRSRSKFILLWWNEFVERRTWPLKWESAASKWWAMPSKMEQMWIQSIEPSSDQTNSQMQYSQFRKMTPTHKWSACEKLELRKIIGGNEIFLKIIFFSFFFLTKNHSFGLIFEKDTHMNARLKSIGSIDRSWSVCSICC